MWALFGASRCQLLCTGCGNGEGHIACVYAKASLAPPLVVNRSAFGTFDFKMCVLEPLVPLGSPGCLLDVSGRCLDAPGCLLSAAGCLLIGVSWVLLGVFWVLLGAPGCSWVCPGHPWVLLGVSWALLGAPGCS